MTMPALDPSRDPSRHHPGSDDDTAGGRLVSADGLALPLRETALRAEARGGLARTVVVQRFENPHAEPLEVTYQLPLPADGAVSGFRFTLGATVIVGEVDRRQSARERYESALVEGRTAALLEQVRSSVFTQRVGNVPPGETLVAEITVDQPLAWLDEGAWEWRFPTVVGARYLGAPGRVTDADALKVDASEAPLPHRLQLSLAVRDAVAPGHRPESPSHPLDVRPDGEGALVALRGEDGVRLDRDVVVRWPVARPEVGLTLTLARGARDDDRYALLTVVPPSRDARTQRLPRDLVVLIDTSGSMGGRPLDQAKHLVSAMIDTLDEEDRLELVEFSSSPTRWQSEPATATPANRRRALAWVNGLRAGGGTEMHTAILEALRPLRPGAQRQVVLVTDGYIGFERQIVEAVLQKLPGSCRLHVVGVGSSVNRSLTAPAARAGRGVEVILGVDEDVERATRKLMARTRAPVVTELTVEGDAVLSRAPSALPDLFADAPVLISLKLREGEGVVRVRGTSARGAWEHAVTAPATERGSGPLGVRARYGREAVEDAETLLAAGADPRETDATIERLGLELQLATRLTSWIAVTEARTVDPDAPRRKETQPQEVPHGTSVEALGLRAPVTPSQSLTRAGSFSAEEFEQSLQALPPAVAAQVRQLALGGVPAPSSSPAPSVGHPPSPMSTLSSDAELAGGAFGAPGYALPSAAPHQKRVSAWAVLLVVLTLAALAALAWWLLLGGGGHEGPARAAPEGSPTAAPSGATR